MTTLVQICQAVLREVGQVNVPSSIVGNTDPAAVQLLALANRTGKILALDFRWQALLTTHTFATVNGTTDYSLPSDLHAFAGLTFWDRTNIEQCEGPVSAVLWEGLRSGNIIGVGLRKYFRVAANLFSIYPTPTAADTIAYQYWSKNWITGKTEFSDDTDQPLIDADLITLGLKWRWRMAKGLAYDEEKADYQMRLDALQAIDGGKNILRFGRVEPAAPALNIPETGYG